MLKLLLLGLELIFQTTNTDRRTIFNLISTHYEQYRFNH